MLKFSFFEKRSFRYETIVFSKAIVSKNNRIKTAKIVFKKTIVFYNDRSLKVQNEWVVFKNDRFRKRLKNETKNDSFQKRLTTITNIIIIVYQTQFNLK